MKRQALRPSLRPDARAVPPTVPCVRLSNNEYNEYNVGQQSCETGPVTRLALHIVLGYFDLRTLYIEGGRGEFEGAVNASPRGLLLHVAPVHAN